MDLLLIPCPSCRHELRLPDLSLLGRFGRCPACRHKFVLEDPRDCAAEAGEFAPRDEIGAPQQELPEREAGETIAWTAGDSTPGGEEEPEVPGWIGRYEIKRPLGQGAMGAVYLAFDTQLHRDVALKVPRFSPDDEQKTIERFYREARLAATLSHPGICPVYDIGEADGTRYIAMACIEGRPLTDYIRVDKPQSLRHVALTICRIAAAVQEAHQRGVIHRDLKPDNIMIDHNRMPVVMDFGLARRVFKPGDEQITHSGSLVGSPAYMSPEQVEASPDLITPSSDIFTLGVVLYELMTGRRPFVGSFGAVLSKILRDDPQPPSQLRPDVDRRIEAICLKMMSRQPADRYTSMEAVAQALAGYLRGSERSSGDRLPTIDLREIRPQTLESLRVEQSSPQGRPTEPPELVRTLIDDANRARRAGDYDGMRQILERLLTINPQHRRAKRVLEELNRRGLGGIAADLSAEREAACWILAQGGSVEVLLEGCPLYVVDTPAGLPRDEFLVASALLSSTSVLDDDLASLAELSDLKHLMLARTGVTDAGLRHLGRLDGLTTLSLAHTGVEGSGLAYLAGRPRLVKLDLTATGVTDAGFASLEPLPSLEFLSLFAANVTDDSVDHLACFGGLAFLDLYDSGLTSAGVARLSRSLPNCRINF